MSCKIFTAFGFNVYQILYLKVGHLRIIAGSLISSGITHTHICREKRESLLAFNHSFTSFTGLRDVTSTHY